MRVEGRGRNRSRFIPFFAGCCLMLCLTSVFFLDTEQLKAMLGGPRRTETGVRPPGGNAGSTAAGSGAGADGAGQAGGARVAGADGADGSGTDADGMKDSARIAAAVPEAAENADAKAAANAGEANAGEANAVNTASPEEQWKESFYPVPATPPVDIRYFDDALFIGDSRVVGLMLYSGLAGASFYSEKGINVSNLLTKAIVTQTGGAKITIPEALKQQRFGKIYIKLGLNELGWPYPDRFVKAYGEVIDQIRETQPDAVFYVQSILPVSGERSAEDKLFKNERIVELNTLIQKMAWEKGIHYLDVYHGLSDGEGNLPADAGSDGIHLNKTYCLAWLDFLMRHTFRDFDRIRL